MDKEEYFQKLFKKYSYIARPKQPKIGKDNQYHWSEAWYDKADPTLISDFKTSGYRVA